MKPMMAKIGALAALGVGLTLAAQAPASALPARAEAITIAVHPATNLPETGPVTVSGSGLQADHTYYAQECGVLDASPTGYSCDPDSRIKLDSSTGSYNAPLTVHKTFVGYSGNGAQAPVDCGEVQCVVAVASVENPDPVTAPLTFQ